MNEKNPHPREITIILSKEVGTGKIHFSFASPHISGLYCYPTVEEATSTLETFNGKCIHNIFELSANKTSPLAHFGALPLMENLDRYLEDNFLMETLCCFMLWAYNLGLTSNKA